jgi:hypothetical protein
VAGISERSLRRSLDALAAEDPAIAAALASAGYP